MADLLFWGPNIFGVLIYLLRKERRSKARKLFLSFILSFPRTYYLVKCLSKYGKAQSRYLVS